MGLQLPCLNSDMSEQNNCLLELVTEGAAGARCVAESRGTEELTERHRACLDDDTGNQIDELH